MAKDDAGSRAGGQVSVFQALEADDPERLGDYPLTARLGAGGMGKVYLSHTPAGRPVAIKAIRPELADDPNFRRRFRREVAAARRVHGLFTAPVIDSEVDAPALWLATAFVQGPTLSAAVSQHGTLPLSAVLLLAAGVAEALQAVHGEGIVHRDLKASNVLLASDGPRVIDFGIARAVDSTALTDTGVTVGTPAFMSPEQALNEEAGPATDIFSLGQLITYAVKGTPAFGGGQTYGVLYRIVHEEPDLTDVPEALLPLLNRCLAKAPDKRPSPAEVIGLCRTASEGGTLRRTGNWLPAAITADLTRHQENPPQAGTDRQPPEDEAESTRTGSPELNGDAPNGPGTNGESGADAGADEEPVPDAGADGLTPASPPVPSVSHSGVNSANRPPTQAPPPDVRESDLANPAEFRVLERSEYRKLTHRAASGSSGRHDAAGARNSGRPTGNGETGSPKRTEPAAAGNGGRRAPAGTPPATGSMPSRRTVIALGATALAGAGTAAVLALREDSDAKNPQRPQRAKQKKITVTTASTLRFPEIVDSVGFSPDSKTLAVIGDMDEIRLANVATGKTKGALTSNSAGCVAFSPEGKTLAVGGSDSTVRLWDVATGENTDTFTKHTDMVRALAFSRDGRTLASASDDNTVRLWDVATGKNTDTLTGHRAMVWSVAFSPDGKSLASGGSDRMVRVWDVATGRNTEAFDQKVSLNSVAFSPDARTLASGGGGADNTVRLWDIAKGKSAGTLTGHTGGVYSVAFSPDGKSLASASDDNTVRLWDVATGESMDTLTGHTEMVWSVAFSPDGRTLATGSRDKTVRLWKASGNARIAAARIDQ